jgi:hypothetical protein
MNSQNKIFEKRRLLKIWKIWIPRLLWKNDCPNRNLTFCFKILNNILHLFLIVEILEY